MHDEYAPEEFLLDDPEEEELTETGLTDDETEEEDEEVADPGLDEEEL